MFLNSYMYLSILAKIDIYLVIIAAEFNLFPLKYC